MMTEEQKQALIGLCKIEIRRWKHAAEAVPDKRYMVELMEIALTALTQPASPALKLPDGWVAVPRKPTPGMMVAGTLVSEFQEDPSGMYLAMLAAAPAAPHTAPIEPICATGGWQDPLLHPAIIALKNGEIHAPEVLDIFDAMAREIQVHRDYKRWDYAPKCSTGGAEWVKVSERMPKRGQRVNAFYLNRLGRGRTIRAEYIYSKTEEAGECDPDTQCVEYCEESDTYFVTEGWYEVMDNWEEYGSIAVTEGNITHWMPLPAAPTS